MQIKDIAIKKSQYFEKLNYLFSKYNRIILVDTTNVGSNQIQMCRKELGVNSVMIIGKNSLIKKVLARQIKKKTRSRIFHNLYNR